MAIWSQTIHDFPGTLAAKGAAVSWAKAQAQEAEEDARVPEGLEVGQRFPSFTEQDIYGSPLTLAAYHGRLRSWIFGATWCEPCREELPNVIATYTALHPGAFEIIGVTLDDDKQKAVAFTQANGMTWAQYFDGQGWKNKLAQQYQVSSIPMTYLLDRHGVIIGKALRGLRLSTAVAKAVE